MVCQRRSDAGIYACDPGCYDVRSQFDERVGKAVAPAGTPMSDWRVYIYIYSYIYIYTLFYNFPSPRHEQATQPELPE